MQAALLYGKNDLRIEEVSKPEISAGEVLVRVRAAAVCGSDIRMFRNGSPNISADHPLILGHELSGTIERVGAGVDAYKTGMRVAVAPNMGCGSCSLCISGNTHLCPRFRSLGITMHGAFATFVRIPSAAVTQGNLALMGDGLAYITAAAAEPLACVYSAFERSELLPGQAVLIIGAGPVGLMHAKLAGIAGADPIFVTDLNEERLSRVTAVDDRFQPLVQNDLKKQILALTGGRGVDLCITAAPSAEAQQEALELVGINGRVVFFGGLPTGQSEVPLDTNLIHYKQITVTGTTRSNLRQYRRVLELLTAKRLDIDSLITHTGTLDDLPSAFDRVIRGQGLKQVVVWED